MKSLRRSVFLVAAALASAVLPMEAAAVYECGGEQDTCDCGASNFCICCDGTCANCVWHAWHSACCNWGRALEWCTDAQFFNDRASSRGYPTGGDPCDGSIFVCEPSGTCSGWGHVGWVVTAHSDGSFSSTEQFCGGQCGTFNKNRPAGFATGGFIYNPSGGCNTQPVETDDAKFESETVPDGTRIRAGERFTKRWTMRNAGNTTWTRGGNYLLTHDGDERFGAEEQTLLPDGISVGPGNTWDWNVEMTAPAASGTYRGYWKMDRFGIHRFGTRVWVEIVVDAPVDGDGDGYEQTQDCNDSDRDIHPGATENCNGLDDNCDGQTDERVKNRCGTCGPEPEEICDGRDNDCDGEKDEGCPEPRDAGGPRYDAGRPARDTGITPAPDVETPAPDVETPETPDAGAKPASGDPASLVGGGCGCGQAGQGWAETLLFPIACGAMLLAARRRMAF